MNFYESIQPVTIYEGNLASIFAVAGECAMDDAKVPGNQDYRVSVYGHHAYNDLNNKGDIVTRLQIALEVVNLIIRLGMENNPDMPAVAMAVFNHMKANHGDVTDPSFHDCPVVIKIHKPGRFSIPDNLSVDTGLDDGVYLPNTKVFAPALI